MTTAVCMFCLMGWLDAAVRHMHSMWFGSARLCSYGECVCAYCTHLCGCVELVPNLPLPCLVLVSVFSLTSFPSLPSHPLLSAFAFPALTLSLSSCSRSRHHGNKKRSGPGTFWIKAACSNSALQGPVRLFTLAPCVGMCFSVGSHYNLTKQITHWLLYM